MGNVENIALQKQKQRKKYSIAKTEVTRKESYYKKRSNGFYIRFGTVMP
jgi:hypothetical protein